MTNTNRYFIINKPYGMVSQFISADRVRLLGSLAFDFPEGTHAVGRLDSTSEGLLILTTNKRVTRLLFQGERPHRRTYLVRVARHMDQEKVEALRQGIPIRVNETDFYTTLPCEVDIIPTPTFLQPFQLEQRASVPHTWLRISLVEGKFHQIRKMVAAVGHHCRRLIRVSIEDLQLGDLPAGEVRELDEHTFFSLLHIDYTASDVTNSGL